MASLLKETTNKENIQLGSSVSPLETDHLILKRQQDKISRLERLYSDQILKCQKSQDEQERLEAELRLKEESLLTYQSNLSKMTELNRSLSKKLSGDVGYYESELESHKRLEREWQVTINKLRLENSKYERLLHLKNEEISRLNDEVDQLLNDLDIKNIELEKLGETVQNRSMGSDIESDGASEQEPLTVKKRSDLSFDDSFDR